MKQLTEEENVLEEYNKMKEDFNVEGNKNLLKKFKDMKRATANTLNIIDRYCDYFEKYKNIIKWEDPRMTKFLFAIGVSLFVIVTYMPIRLFLLLSFTYRFYKGRRWNDKRLRNNREVCKIELAWLMHKNNVSLDEKKKEGKMKNEAKTKIGKNSDKLSINIDDLEDIEMCWEKILSNTKQGISFKIFERRFFDQFQREFRIYLHKDILTKDCKNPK